MRHRRPGWPEHLAVGLGWRVTVDAVPGSGSLAAGADTDFADRVEVVVLSPFSNGPPGELTTALTGALEEIAARLTDLGIAAD